MTEPLRHDVIIATRNRPGELADCLVSLSTQTRPATCIRIVDASDDDQSEANLRQVAAHPELPIIHTRAEPGTSAQRNLGVAASDAAILHFLDDDTVLEPDYLAEIVACFAADEHEPGHPGAVLGVGGLPTNLPPVRTTRIRSLLLPGATVTGAVLPSGRGVLPAGLTEPTDVDWLSGCAMSFRRRALIVEPFDEGLSGYALGEDLDASYRVRQHGRLIVTPAARLEHRESPRNRWDRARWAKTDVVNRRRRVASGTGGYRVSAFWMDGLAHLAVWALRSCRPGATDARAVTKGMVRGLWAARHVDSASPTPSQWR